MSNKKTKHKSYILFMLFVALVILVLSNKNYNKIDPFILYGVHLLIIFLSLIAILNLVVYRKKFLNSYT